MAKPTWSNRDALRKLAEDTLREGRPAFDVSGMAQARLVHELEVHAAELEMQNEALREAHRELEASRAEYRSLFDLAPIGYVTVDKECRIQAVNLAAADLLGMEREDILGLRLSRFVATAEAGAFALHQREVIGSAARIRSQFTLVCRDGTRRKVMFESQCTNAVIGEWRIAFVDMTETIALDQRLEQTQRLAAVGTQTSGIVHDFKNILSTVLTSAEIALRLLDEESPARRPLERLKRATLRGGLVVSQLLAYTRDQSSEPGIVDLNEMIPSIEPLLRGQLAENVELIVNLGASTAPVRAHGEQIEQALMNLVVNAQHAMPTGGSICIATEDVEFKGGPRRTPPALPEGKYVVVRVCDTGAGMDEQTRARALEPFFTTKPAGLGSGLGLAMVQGVAHRAGGTVMLESEVGRGTTATMFLAKASGSQRPASAPPPIGQPLPAELLILVVSHDTDACVAARDYFRMIGCHAADAADGFDALRVLKEQRDRTVVLLIDGGLANLDRPEFAAAVRAIAPSASIRVVPVGAPSSVRSDGGDAVARSHFAALYDAVGRALAGIPESTR